MKCCYFSSRSLIISPVENVRISFLLPSDSENVCKIVSYSLLSIMKNSTNAIKLQQKYRIL